MRFLTGSVILMILFGCSKSPETVTGTWQAEINLQDKPLPFSFEIRDDSTVLTAILHNGKETFYLNEVSVVDDSLKMVMHIFDSEIRAKISGDSLTGFFTKNFAANYKLPFKALRALSSPKSQVKLETENFSGKYAMTFVHEEKDTTVGIGIFEQTDNNVYGTILTPLGDYRYLNGSVNNGELSLHTFDGEHLYVFTARKENDSTLVGEYRSGKGWFEPWVGIKNDAATLPDGDSLTLLKDGYTKLDFSFPDLEGKMVSPSDERYKNKVLIIQLFGSWCSNCMDETRFLAEWSRKNQDKEVAILGLAYEQKADYDYARSRVAKMKERLEVPYDFVIAGTKDKDEASKTLPMLNRVIAFPTLIFVGKNGDVRRIHTGFNGPGTGKYYEEYKEDFNKTITRLLSE